MSKEKCFINISGCDDRTLVDIELTKDEIRLLESIAEKSKQISTYSCMPTLKVIKGQEAVELEKEMLESSNDDFYL